VSNGRNLTFVTAKKEMLAEQLKQADIVFLRGGKTEPLLSALRSVPDLGKKLAGKTVVGESAGAYALSELFFSKSMGGVFQGLGFVPVKTICHFDGRHVEQLKDSKLPPAFLPENAFRIFHQTPGVEPPDHQDI